MTRLLLERWLERIWYGGSRWFVALLPLSWLYCFGVRIRRFTYRSAHLASSHPDATIIVVGNLTAGGTGKTPLVVALARLLQGRGYQVGVVTRGYAGAARTWPRPVVENSDPREVGDEAVVLARRTGVPVYAGPDRVAAARALLQRFPVDVLISDDGLQHYALQRDLEIAVLDGERWLGNGHCLPAGPLREPAGRLQEVDAVITMGQTSSFFRGRVKALGVCSVTDPSERRPLESFSGQRLNAVAGIANPQRFFRLLRNAGLSVRERVFADHHDFRAEELEFGDSGPVLMTEKDAVKCLQFAQHNWWYVSIEVELDPAFETWLITTLNGKTT